MTFAPNYFASKRWETVGHQELRSACNKQEIDSRFSGLAQNFSSLVTVISLSGCVMLHD
jgi:hypothetical protein